MLNPISALVVLLMVPQGAPGPQKPNPATAQLEQGQKLFKAGDYTGALAAFEAAAKTDPKDARAYYLRGLVLEKRQDFSGAEHAYRDAISRDSRFAPAHNNLGAL